MRGQGGVGNGRGTRDKAGSVPRSMSVEERGVEVGLIVLLIGLSVTAGVILALWMER